MSLLAVNALVLMAHVNGIQLSAGEKSAWKLIQPKVAVVKAGGIPSGVAVNITDTGRYLTHRSAVGLGTLTLTLSDGKSMVVKLTGNDDVTGLALLEVDVIADVASPGFAGLSQTDARNNYVNVRASQPTAGVKLIVVSTDGPAPAELYNSRFIGLSGSNRRGLTLSEIRFESPSAAKGGSLAFTLDGRLVGVLGATLETAATESRGFIPSGSGFGGGRAPLPGGLGGGGGSATATATKKAIQAEIYGPQGLTVAYSITADILNRVIDGFSSEARKVDHPAMGLMVQDGTENGAKIVSVLKGSGADKGGLKAGDEILSISDTPISSQFEYTRFLLRQKVGSTLSVKYKRAGVVYTTSVVVGS